MDGGYSIRVDMTSTEMEELKTNEKPKYQIIRIFSNACDQKDIGKIEKLYTNNKILQNIPSFKAAMEDDSLARKLLQAETRIEFKNDVIDSILCKFYDEYQDDNNELLFLASAKFEINKLQEVIKELKENPTSNLDIEVIKELKENPTSNLEIKVIKELKENPTSNLEIEVIEELKENPTSNLEVEVIKELKENPTSNLEIEVIKELKENPTSNLEIEVIKELKENPTSNLEIEVIKELKENPTSNLENINQTRFSDSAIVFVLKYGNISNQNFLSCVTALIEAGIDINKFDIEGKSAIDYIAILYALNKNRSEVLKQAAQLILNKGIFKPNNEKTLEFLANDMRIDVDKYKFESMDDKTFLFYCISKNMTDKFVTCKNIESLVNSDNGENTMLQLACKKKDTMIAVVKHLLENGADPNQVTESNSLTPLELAGMNNNQLIFQELLKNKETRIEQEQYNNFVRWRFQPMKPKLFELLLESNKLEPDFTYEKNGNTPLHYAIFFCHKRAIQKLLQLHPSRFAIKNKSDVSVLEIIDPEDLEKYFDSCLALDNYTTYFSHINYKMQFRFNCLVDLQTFRELKVVSKIGSHPNMEHLLTHPFIHTFITLKWFRIKYYFWIVLLFQALTFLLLSLCFYHLVPEATPVELIFCIFCALINIVPKAFILFYFKYKNKLPVFYALDRATLHGCLEILLILTIIGSFFQDLFRAFVFVEMSISFLLTAGYHPRLSKWSIMLQQVFKTFTILLIFFSLIVVAFGTGFHILFPNEELFKNFLTSIFKTFIMTTGEFNIEKDTGLDKSGFGGYTIFFLFAMSMSLVIVNFWTGVAVTDIERIEKNSAINASKNVIVFMSFIDYIYTKNFLKVRNCLPNPLLFLRINKDGSTCHNPEECKIDFFVNKEKQFEKKTDKETFDFPSKLDDECFNKIKCHYYKLKSARISGKK